MHASSFENMQKCYQNYIAGSHLENQDQVKILDIGGADVNGSYAEIFNQENFEYIGVDIKANPGVSIVLDDPHVFPLEDNSIDVVISGQMFEHCEYFWLVFKEMTRVVKEDGFIFLIAPSSGPQHKFPVDCYRFYPDAYRALAKFAQVHLTDVWWDNKGPWNDLVGVFSKKEHPQAKNKSIKLETVIETNLVPEEFNPDLEKIKGSLNYIQFLDILHENIEPKNYLEIGVRFGTSIALAKNRAVGVDPSPAVNVELSKNVEVIEQTSDHFFELNEHEILSKKPELTFIDGMHLIEFVLRDFMNVEKISGKDSVVVLDDVFPNLPEQARRKRITSAWTGDVWKIYRILQEYRPDLCLIPVNTHPTGLLIVLGLDPDNQVLWQNYNKIVRKALNEMQDPDEAILSREGALEPKGKEMSLIVNAMGFASRNDGLDTHLMRDIKDIISGEYEEKNKIKRILSDYERMNQELNRNLILVEENKIEINKLTAQNANFVNLYVSSNRFYSNILKEYTKRPFYVNMFYNFYYKALKFRQYVELKRLGEKRFILKSGLFDEQWYLENNIDVKKSGMNPLDHYLLHGAQEGRQPIKDFNVFEYAEKNKEYIYLGINVFTYFVLNKLSKKS